MSEPLTDLPSRLAGRAGCREELPGGAATDTELRQLRNDLLRGQFGRLTGEIPLQVARRDGTITTVFKLVTSVSALIGVAGTTGVVTEEPLIALYGAFAFSVWLPIVMESIYHIREHADTRIGELHVPIRLMESILPEGTRWDSERLLRTDERPGPRPDLERSAKVLAVAVDAYALVLAAGALIAAVVVGPWWTWIITLPALGPLAIAVWASVQTYRLIRHERGWSGSTVPIQ